MLFYEPLFLFVFFPVVLLLFLAARRRPRGREIVLLAASLGFYLWSEPFFVPVVLATCIADYALGRAIGAGGNRAALVAGVLINLAMLAIYKYTGFAVANVNAALGAVGFAPWHVPAPALPIGVSFIVFEKITYLVDIHRGRSRPAPGFGTYLLYVFLFPKLLAGPIIKYHELEAQLIAFGRNHRDDLAVGFQRFMLGMAKKTILADTLAAGADMSFAADPMQLGFADAWYGVLFFTFQIYIDFSAYSDMAIGLARMLGFRLRENFDQPYLSASITEFWRRWHISLSTWIRDYLYIPLGGNRVSPARQYLNLWLCFLASGLWHGAAWTYVLWGAYNGVFLVLDRLFLLRLLHRLPRPVATAITFLVVALGWVVFRAADTHQAGVLYAALLQPGRVSSAVTVWRSPAMLAALAAAAVISFVPLTPRLPRWPLGTSLLFVVALCFALANPFKPFLYFRF